MSATAAPVSPASRFTPSLSNHGMPPIRCVTSPQVCTARSVSAPHRAHRRRDCRTAPANESANAPAIPPAAAATATYGGQCTSHAITPTNAPPATLARRPTIVTPPDVPVATRRHVVINRGVRDESVPTSVPHVSAEAAASAPPPIAIQAMAGATRDASAARANRPPLASTCTASRVPPLATTDSVRRNLFSRWARESAVPVTKKAKRRAPHDQPAASAAVPTIIAVSAPLRDSARARHATNEIAHANANPTAVRAITPTGARLPRRSTFA